MLDNLAIFSDDQAITADAASTNSIQFMPFTGRGEPVTILMRVTETFTNLTSMHISVQESSDDAVADAYADVISTREILLAELTAGSEFAIRFLPNANEDYIQLHYDITGSAPNAGKIFAAIVVGEDYPFVDGLYYSPRNTTGAAATA